jgi:hypothetical protein
LIAAADFEREKEASGDRGRVSGSHGAADLTEKSEKKKTKHLSEETPKKKYSAAPCNRT